MEQGGQMRKGTFWLPCEVKALKADCWIYVWVTSSLSHCAYFPNTQKGGIILCDRLLGRIYMLSPV